MRNADAWIPSKFVIRNGKLDASSDEKEVAAGSRLIVSLLATRFEAAIRQYVRGRLVDLGCGKVPLYEIYRQYVTSTLCVDWPFGKHGRVHVDCICDLNEPLPLADGAFDTIILSDVLEHLHNPNGFCSEMARILALNGRLLLNVPFLYWVHEAPFDYYRYTEYALRRLMHTAGLSIISLQAVGGSPEVIVDILAKHATRLSMGRRRVAAVLHGAAVWWLRRGITRRISERTSARFPLGYFLVGEKRALPQ